MLSSKFARLVTAVIDSVDQETCMFYFEAQSLQCFVNAVYQQYPMI